VSLEEIESERAVLVALGAADADDLAGLLEEPSLREWLAAHDVGELRERFSAWESRRSPDGDEAWLNWVIDDANAPSARVAVAAGFERTAHRAGDEVVWEHRRTR